MGWFYSTTQQMKLVTPAQDQDRLPAPRRQLSRFQAARKAARTSLQVVSEFRSKMRMAEELIAKLAFSLREIQGSRKRPKLNSLPASQSAKIIQVDSDRFNSHAKL